MKMAKLETKAIFDKEELANIGFYDGQNHFV
jgi:hypothetical protein